MRFSRDRRGQSVVVGTVILFGFLILALSLYQVQIVPQENSDIEFDHSQQVEDEFLDLRNAVLNSAQSGGNRLTSLTLGTRYPQRTFSLNPPPATGDLSTSDQQTIRIESATVAEDGNVEQFWEDRDLSFPTKSVRYSPAYNEYQNAPDLVYENSMVVAEFDGTALTRTGQTAVTNDADQISLTLIDGNLSESGIERREIDPEVLSQNARSVTLEPDGGEVVITLPTTVPEGDKRDELASGWNETFESDVDRTVTATADGIRIEVETTESVQLRLSQIGLGTGTSAPDESTGYIKKVSSDDGVAVAEVRDRFNNPVEDASVVISADGTEISRQTDEDGRVSYEVDDVSDVEMRINADTEPWESVLFENLGVADPDGVEALLVAPDEAVAYNGPGSLERGGFQLDIENQHDGLVRITDVTVLPENPDINGISDEADGSGPGRSELYVESNSGDVGDKNVLMAVNQEYAFVPNSGLQLNLQRGPEKRAYDIFTEEYADVETEFAGDEVPLVSNERATITLAEFYEVGQSTATVVDVTGERFSVTVGYKIDGERRTEQFVTTIEEEPIGSVNLQDDIEDTDEGFEVTTDQYQNLAEGWVVVENSETGQTESFESTDGQTTTVDSADVGGTAAGDEIIATLYESDAEQNELDADSTIVSGDPFGVFVQPDGGFGGQDDLDATFDVSAGADTYDFEVTAFRSGSNQGGTVTIDGNSYELADGATTAFVSNAEEIDLLNTNTYQGLSAAEEQRLEAISQNLNSDSDASNLVNTGDADLLPPDIRAQ